MEIYLLKSAVCLGLFFAFYKLVLERTSMHHFKRFYLFGSVFISFAIPFITFTTFVEPSSFTPIYTDEIPQALTYETIETINYWPFVLWTIYGLGVLFFSVKFSRNLFTLIQKIRKNTKYKKNRFTNILLNETVIPHTFFSYIFLNKQKFENNEIPEEIILHEEAHALQKHSLDILLIELLQIVFWFNPIIYFIKRSIKLNHEFLADQAVLNAGAETSEYQKLLLTFSSNTEMSSLAHSINYSSFKKRFTVMRTHTSKRAVLLRSFLLLPLLSIMIYGFSTKETVEKSTLSSSISTNETIEDIQIKIDENSKISLNGKTVALSNLKDEINKLNTKLSEEQKRKYLMASIDIENNSLKSVAEEVGNILYSCNIRSWNVTSLQGEKDAGLKHIPWNNPKAGKTIEEAEVIYQQEQAEVERFKKSRAKIKNDESNPWSIQVGENVERDETTGKIIQQKATKAEVKEYNKLAKKYNAVAIEKRSINQDDLKRLEAIYAKMTDAQKAKAEPFPQTYQSQSEDKTFKKTGFNYNTNIKINDSIPTPATPSFYSDNKKEPLDDKTIFMYNDRVITMKKSIALLKDKSKDLYLYMDTTNGKKVARMSDKPFKNAKKIVPPPPSPPPAPPRPTLMTKNNVLNLSSSKKTGFHFNTNKTTNLPMYYYNDKLIPFSKAHKLLSENPALKMYIMKDDSTYQTVILSEKPVLGRKQLEESRSSEKEN